MYVIVNSLIGNAFVSYLEQTGNSTPLSMEKINNFGLAVVENLKSQDIDAYLDISEDQINDFFCKYSKWFTFNKSDNLVILNDGVTIFQLAKEFSNHLCSSLFNAFKNEECVKELL